MSLPGRAKDIEMDLGILSILVSILQKVKSVVLHFLDYDLLLADFLTY